MAHKAGMKASIKAKVAAHKAHRLPTRPRLKQRLLHIRRIRKVIGFIFYRYYIDVKILLVKITFIECPILAPSNFLFYISKLGFIELYLNFILAF